MERAEDNNMDSLYIAWSEDRHAAAPQSLADWIANRPECADELTLWTAAAPVLDYAETLADDTAGAAKTAAVGRQVLAEMRAMYEAKQAAPLVSLSDAAKAQGLTLKTLARQVGVGFTVVCKLQDRLIRAATVPQELAQRLADALGVQAQQIRAYLQQPPTLAAGAMYKSANVPQVSDAQDFSAAVQNALDMPAEQKTFWLAAE